MPFPSTASPTTVTSALKFKPRRSQDRGHANHNWLKTYHTFSFASYQDYEFEKFGPLRVINEDRVEPGRGFGKHPHANFEIWSYIVSGELKHEDSFGGKPEIMKRGDIQMTSTGKGVFHSEHQNGDVPVHFLQIWALPSKTGLEPKYFTRRFTDEEKRDKLVKVVAPATEQGVINARKADGPAPVHASLSMYASILSPGASIKHIISDKITKAYLHNIMLSGYRSPSIPAGEKFEDGGAKLRVNNSLQLEEGDGAFVTVGKEGEREVIFENNGTKDAEFVWFEMA
ncbi:pirin domain-containing protein [Meredithblackwellia eburnea MCA 4105]